MISNTAQVNTFTQGMNLDTDVNLLPNEQYRYAENVRVITNDGGTTGVLQNIESVRKYWNSLYKDEVVIGTATIDQYGVVITKMSNGYNRVYRISGFDTNMLTIQVVCQGDLKLSEDIEKHPNISIVCNYESEKNIKIYFTDGESPVKILNIMDQKYSEGSDLVDDEGNIINPEAIDMTPSAELPPLQVNDLSFGNLPTGVVQYCYQLFNVHGTETVTSPLSQMIHLTQSSTNQDSQKYEGSYPDTSSGKACNLSAPITVKDFQRARIISIRYTDNSQIAKIIIVDELDITKDQKELHYVDSGNSMLSELSLEEFNALTGYQFIANTLAKMDNRLFAANIQDNTWDPGEFDARAYRFNQYGVGVLESANTSSKLTITTDYDLSTVPYNHDCINPYNSMEYSNTSEDVRYIYGKKVNDNNVLGGYGTNIEYNFCTIPIELSEKQKQLKLDHNTSMNVRSRIMNSVSATNVGTSTTGAISFNQSGTQTRIPNYADPYISAYFKGYQRDEVYRFGIVFYNNKMIPSPVYWIGDIKMPHADQIPPFVYQDNTLIGQALGIRFTVKDKPEGTVAYEIVRCDRTELDRSIITQCVGSNLYEYRIQEDSDAGHGSELDSSIEMRPAYMLTYHKENIKTWTYGNNTVAGKDYIRFYQKTDKVPKPTYVENYLRIISPEICVAQADFEKYFKDSTYLDPICTYMSPIAPTGVNRKGLPESQLAYTFAQADRVLQYNGSIKQVSNWSDFVFREDGELTMDLQCTDKDWNPIPYNASIAKYYYPKYKNTANTAVNIPIRDARYPSDIPYNAYHDVTPYRVTVGERTYTNYAMSNFDTNNQQVTLGAAGPCIIIQTENLDKYNSRFSGVLDPNFNELHSINALPVFNVKRSITAPYGGNTYASRQNSVYITTNAYKNSGSCYVYGGDTFLNVLDYANMFTFQANDEEDAQYRRRYMGAYIPFESSINMNLFNGSMAHRTYTSDNYIDSHMQLEPTQKGVYHAQDRPYYVYNSVYSTQQTTKKYVPSSIYAEHYYINEYGERINITIPNRILSSQVKTNNEVIDSWSKFKVADYLDVDNQWGDISNLKVFKDRLFYFQDTGVGIASVNERSLVTDDNANQLVLGTGGILSRYDYITNTNGDSVINDRSIVNSDNVLYWYDYDKNEICSYSGAVSQISKEKQVQSYLNSNLTNRKKGYVTSLFDKKYNEVWFRLLDKSLIFNEQIGRFTSFYTFAPQWSLPLSNRCVTMKDMNFYTINNKDIKGLESIDKDAKLTIVINKDMPYTKVFDNVRLQGHFKDEAGNNITDGIIKSIDFYTKDQHTNAIPDYTTGMDYREDTYRIPVPRADKNEDELSLPARMRGKYMICDYDIDSLNEHTFEIPQITTTYRYSLI